MLLYFTLQGSLGSLGLLPLESQAHFTQIFYHNNIVISASANTLTTPQIWLFLRSMVLQGVLLSCCI